MGEFSGLYVKFQEFFDQVSEMQQDSLRKLQNVGDFLKLLKNHTFAPPKKSENSFKKS